MQHDNLCPECEGIGYIEGDCIFPGSYWEPPDYDFADCPVCGGLGVLTVPVAEADAPPAWISNTGDGAMEFGR